MTQKKRPGQKSTRSRESVKPVRVIKKNTVEHPKKQTFKPLTRRNKPSGKDVANVVKLRPSSIHKAAKTQSYISAAKKKLTTTTIKSTIEDLVADAKRLRIDTKSQRKRRQYMVSFNNRIIYFTNARRDWTPEQQLLKLNRIYGLMPDQRVELTLIH